MFLSSDIQKQVKLELTSVRSQRNSIPLNSKGGGIPKVAVVVPISILKQVLAWFFSPPPLP